MPACRGKDVLECGLRFGFSKEIITTVSSEEGEGLTVIDRVRFPNVLFFFVSGALFCASIFFPVSPPRTYFYLTDASAAILQCGQDEAQEAVPHGNISLTTTQNTSPTQVQVILSRTKLVSLKNSQSSLYVHLSILFHKTTFCMTCCECKILLRKEALQLSAAMCTWPGEARHNLRVSHQRRSANTGVIIDRRLQQYIQKNYFWVHICTPFIW